MPIEFYDTTLRDGAQAEDISFTLNDKLRITELLDDFGIHYIEGGWPASNPKDLHYFREVKKIHLKNSKIVAFSSTIRKTSHPESDESLRLLLDADTEYVTIVGKSWDLHVKDALRVSLDTNLRMVEKTIEYLKKHGKKVFFDAEHFFDGYKRNSEYSMKVLYTAVMAGADALVLCDTNGGSMPYEVYEIVKKVKEDPKITVKLGIHTHNDTEMAVANTIMAVKAGCVHVQGTINGYGERCGNANLCSVIPNVILKMGLEGIDKEKLKNLRRLSLTVDEIANLIPDKKKPYVGESAFAHKGGIHVSAVRRNPETYEHIPPQIVGNKQRVLVSDLSGESNIIQKAKEFGIELDSEKDKKHLREILKKIKEMELFGYQFEGADGTLELLIKKVIGLHKKYFDLIGFRVIVEKKGKMKPVSEATIMVKVNDQIEHTAALGCGPVNALDNALRKALHKFYPSLKEVELVDYKVRVLTTEEGTRAPIRVLIETSDGKRVWGTVGVSENIIEASWEALVDSIDYKLLIEEERERGKVD
ncbi:MAG: citramalate synthase [Desulfobacterota bacterium]|nr:citramalate synthase [Thermodesulfobacteriota bacterium]MDW8002257.1 citramalate synthase [Deltaproteobacteria bacterium]